MNFQHIDGDIENAVTRNAFELSSSKMDKVFRKYMIERGLVESDFSAFQKHDIIRNIIQSEFTWVVCIFIFF